MSNNKIVLNDCGVNDCNGDGLRIEGDWDAEVTNFQAFNVGGHGINAIKHSSLMSQLGLPVETNPKQLSYLLSQLINKNQDDQIAIINKSGFVEKLSKYSPSASIISSLLSISANSNVHHLIKTLSDLI